MLAGVVRGLVVGKPLGVCLPALAAVELRIGIMPGYVTVRAVIGAAWLCGIGDPVSLLLWMADQAFPQEQ